LVSESNLIVEMNPRTQEQYSQITKLLSECDDSMRITFQCSLQEYDCMECTQVELHTL